MHILMLSDVYFPRINGVSTSIQTFSRSFLNQGHQVTLIAPEYPYEFDAGVEILRVSSRRLPFDPEDRLMSLRQCKRLLPELKDRDIDIVHIQTPFVAHYAGVYLAQQLGARVVVSYHTFFEAYFEKYLPRLPKSWLRSVARRFSCKQCNQADGVISPSRQMLERLRDYGVTQRAEVIPTGLPAQIFQQCRKNAFRKRHGLPENAFVLLYVGRVAYEKNIDLLLDMFERVRMQAQHAILLIAGEGPALEGLRARTRDKDSVRFVGYLDRSTELLECYQASDTFVFASQTETQGLVLLEAMASALPVVSTASMGSVDVLTEGEGCLISPPDPDAFAERVLSLVHDDGARAELSRRGVEYARGWGSDVLADRMLGFYQQLLLDDERPLEMQARVGGKA